MFKSYFTELEEESVRDNFVIIYELLDEVMDFGHPQTTDSKILQQYITQQVRTAPAYDALLAAYAVAMLQPDGYSHTSPLRCNGSMPLPLPCAVFCRRRKQLLLLPVSS